jgi:hypothetical protein
MTASEAVAVLVWTTDPVALVIISAATSLAFGFACGFVAGRATAAMRARA